MKNSLWKLTALAGVVGIVMLAFLQAQQGLKSPDPDEFVPVDQDQLTAAPEFGSEGTADAFAAIPNPEDDGFEDDFSGEPHPFGDPDGAAFAVGDPDADPREPPDPRERVDPRDRPRDAIEDSVDPWETDRTTPPRREEPVTPIRRRDDETRTADLVDDDPRGRVDPVSAEEDVEPPAILRVGSEDMKPIPELAGAGDEFGPDLFREDPVPADDAGDDWPTEGADGPAMKRSAEPDEFRTDDFSADEFGPLEDPDLGSPGPAAGSTDRTEPTRRVPASDDEFEALDEFNPVPLEIPSADGAPERRVDPRDAESFDPDSYDPDDFGADLGKPGDEADLDTVPDLRPTPDTLETADPADEFDPTDEFDGGPGPAGAVDPRERPERIREFDVRDPRRDRGDEFDIDPREMRSTIADPEPVPSEPARGDFRVDPTPDTEFDPDPAPGPGPAELLPREDETLDPAPEPRRVVPSDDADNTDDTDGRVQRADLIGDATLDPSAPVAPQRPQLTIEKIAPEVSALGQPLVYTIVVRNVGETPARKVVVEDRIPKGTELTGTIPRAELVEKTLRWKLGTIVPGETKKIAVRVMPIEEGQIGSIATVNFVATVAARTRITSPQLKFTMTAPKKVPLGKPVPFQFDVVNNGNAPATGVVVRDLVPAGLHHPGGDDLEYTVGDLEPGERKTVTLSLTAQQVGRVVNRAVARAEGGAEVEAKATVEIVGASLDVSRTGPSKRYVGRAGTYSNVVVNNGEAPITGVTVVEKLPEGTVFVEAGAGGQYNAERREVAWRIERLGPKQSSVLKVKLACRTAGVFTSTVTAAATSGESARVSAVTEVIGFTALGLDIEGGGPPVFLGDTVTFKVAAGNRGSSNASNVDVTIAVSPELELASVNAPVKYTRAGNEIRFVPVPTLGGRATATFEMTFRAVKPGDGRIRARINADDLDKPLEQDESVRVVAETP